MSAKELRELSAEDLQAKAAELRADVTQLNMKRYAHRLDKSSDLVTAKKDLARVLTILGEKSRAAAGGAS
jgi:large subunit ribosomal protein L29